MPKRNNNLTVEQIREQNRLRGKRFYDKNVERMRKESLERYYNKRKDCVRDIQDNKQG